MYQDKSLRDKEWVTHELAQRAWAKRRVGKSVAQTDRRGRGDVADQMMREYLQEEGLLPVSEPKSVSEQK